MKAVVYRGTHEIGGTFIELFEGKNRLLLDAGYPLFLNQKPIDDALSKLPPEKQLELGILPDIKGLYRWDEPQFQGVVVSHAHIDHYGLMQHIHPDIPIYLSKGTLRLIEISQRFQICENYPINAHTFNMYETFAVGEFAIKPYLMDHSAFDAAAFEIRYNGKMAIYSGDFRGHGRKSVCFDRFLDSAPKQTNVLFTEGSMLARQDEEVLTEGELEMAIVDSLKTGKQIALFQTSSQNIDRIVSFYRASLRLNRLFVVDVYTANVLYELRQLGNNIPCPGEGYDNIRVFYPYRITQKVFNEIGAEYAKRFAAFHISKQEINKRQGEVMIFARPSMLGDLKRCNFTGGTFIYSLWQGYRATPYQQRFEEFLLESGFRIKHLHTSGHACVQDIQKLMSTLDAKLTVPIHTLSPESFETFSDSVRVMEDGQEINIV